jgi:type IV pilus assembly protein PilB
MEENRLRLGEILVDAGVLQEDRLAEALEIQKKRGLRLGQILLQEGFISEPQLVQALSRRLSIPWVSLEHVDIADELLELVPANLAEEFFLIPVYIQTLDRNNRTLFVAMNDPTDESALRLVAASAGMPVKPMVAGPSDISAAIYTYYYGADEPDYDTPMIHSSSPPPIPPVPSKPAMPAIKTVAVPQQPEPESEPPEMLTDDQLLEELVDSTRPSKVSGVGSISIAELSQSSAPPTPIPDGELSDIAEIVESRNEIGSQQQQSHRQVEKHMFGLGMSKHRGMSLTLLDGTTIDFGGANQKRALKVDTDKDRLLAALRAAATGAAPLGNMPSDRWEQYIAAILDVLFRKHLVFPEEFMRALNRTDSE